MCLFDFIQIDQPNGIVHLFYNTITLLRPLKTLTGNTAFIIYEFFFTTFSLNNLYVKMKLLIAATLIASTSAMSAGYLQNLASNAAVAGAGIGGYLDALPIATSAPTAGPGMANYLDSVTAPAPVAPAPVAPVAVAPTPVAPAAPAAR